MVSWQFSCKTIVWLLQPILRQRANKYLWMALARLLLLLGTQKSAIATPPTLAGTTRSAGSGVDEHAAGVPLWVEGRWCDPLRVWQLLDHFFLLDFQDELWDGCKTAVMLDPVTREASVSKFLSGTSCGAQQALQRLQKSNLNMKPPAFTSRNDHKSV